MTRSERLEEIRRREEAATPGPWESKCRSVGNEENDPAWPETDFLQFHVHGTDGSEDEVAGPKEVTWGRGDFYGRDADFIAHTREDIPWLLAEVERLEGVANEASNIIHGEFCGQEKCNGVCKQISKKLDGEKICHICHAGPVPLSHDCTGRTT